MRKIEFEFEGKKYWYYHKEDVMHREAMKWLSERLFQPDKEWDKFNTWFEQYYKENYDDKKQG